MFEILVAYLQAARLMKESMEKQEREKKMRKRMNDSDGEDGDKAKRPTTPNIPLFNEVFRELEASRSRGEKSMEVDTGVAQNLFGGLIKGKENPRDCAELIMMDDD